MLFNAIVAHPMEVLAMQRVYNYITEIKSMPNRRLPKQAWTQDARYKRLKIAKSSHLASAWHYEIVYKMVVKNLLELLGDAIKYVITEDRLLEALKDSILTPNIGPEKCPNVFNCISLPPWAIALKDP